MSAVRVVLYPQRSIFISQGDKSSKFLGNLKNTNPIVDSPGCKNTGYFKGSKKSISVFLIITLSPGTHISSILPCMLTSFTGVALIVPPWKAITGKLTEYGFSDIFVISNTTAIPYCPPAKSKDRRENLISFLLSLSISSTPCLIMLINTPNDDKISIGVSKNFCTNIILIYKNYINKQNIIIIIKNNKRVFVDFAQTYETRGGGQGHKPSAFVLICGGLL